MANSEHVKILSDGVEVWNQWRADSPDIRADLRKADLRDIELPGADLRNALLTGCNFRDAVFDGADLSSATMNVANLRGAKFRRATLVGANFESANLEAADASNADLSEAIFQSATLGNAVLVGANLSGSNFRDAGLMSCDLTSANLSRTDFRDANLQKAILVGASIEYGDFRRSQLNRTNFGSARLTYARFREATLNRAVLVEALVSNADFRQAQSLTCEQLTQAVDWQGAYRDPALACGAEIPEPTEDGMPEAVGLPLVAVPASDRVVTLDHNSAEYKEVVTSLDAVIAAFREDHRLNNALGREHSAILHALDGAKELLQDSQVHLGAVTNLVLRPLRHVWEIAKRYDNQVVTGLAITAFQAAAKYFGLL